MVISTFFLYVFLNMVFISTGVAESSPIFQWVMLELSMMSILPLLMKSGSFSSTQTSMKYFISQSPVSLWILASMLVFNVSIMGLLITPALLFKLGLPPFHGWVITLSESISTMNLGLVLTIQKFIPMSLSLAILNLKLIMLSIFVFTIVISLLSNHLSSMKIILVISSIAGTYWPLFSQNSSSMWLEYMILYSLTLFTLMNFFRSIKVFYLKDLFNETLFTKMLVVCFLLSMGGIPPFSGFFIKIMLIKNVIFSSPLTLFLALSMSFLILYLYMSIFTMVLMNNWSNNVKKKLNLKLLISMMFLLSPAPVILFSFF